MKKLFSLLFVFSLIACGGSDDDDESMGRTTDPIIGTWVVTYDVGLYDEETQTITFNANRTILDRTVPVNPPNCVFSCTGTWSNTSPNTDYNSLTQRYTFSFDASACNPNNSCDGLDAVYSDDPVVTSITFSDDFNSFTIDGETYRRQ